MRKSEGNFLNVGVQIYLIRNLLIRKRNGVIYDVIKKRCRKILFEKKRKILGIYNEEYWYRV